MVGEDDRRLLCAHGKDTCGWILGFSKWGFAFPLTSLLLFGRRTTEGAESPEIMESAHSFIHGERARRALNGGDRQPCRGGGRIQHSFSSLTPPSIFPTHQASSPHLTEKGKVDGVIVFLKGKSAKCEPHTPPLAENVEHSELHTHIFYIFSPSN